MRAEELSEEFGQEVIQQRLLTARRQALKKLVRVARGMEQNSGFRNDFQFRACLALAQLRKRAGSRPSVPERPNPFTTLRPDGLPIIFHSNNTFDQVMEHLDVLEGKDRTFLRPEHFPNRPKPGISQKTV